MGAEEGELYVDSFRGDREGEVFGDVVDSRLEILSLEGDADIPEPAAYPKLYKITTSGLSFKTSTLKDELVFKIDKKVAVEYVSIQKVIDENRQLRRRLQRGCARFQKNKTRVSQYSRDDL